MRHTEVHEFLREARKLTISIEAEATDGIENGELAYYKHHSLLLIIGNRMSQVTCLLTNGHPSTEY